MVPHKQKNTVNADGGPTILKFLRPEVAKNSEFWRWEFVKMMNAILFI